MLTSLRWEPWKAVSRGGVGPDSDAHRCPLWLLQGGQAVRPEGWCWATDQNGGKCPGRGGDDGTLQGDTASASLAVSSMMVVLDHLHIEIHRILL